jgi:inactivated superfamily I helicase
MPLALRPLTAATPYLMQVVEDLLLSHTEPGELKSLQRTGACCDLSHCLLVTPAARAGRRLLELLVSECAQRGILLVPPRLLTLTGLHDLLVSTELSLATPLQRQLACMRVLQELPPAQRAVLLPDAERVESSTLLFALAQRVDALFQELGGACCELSKLQVLLEQRGLEEEAERWHLLEQVAQGVGEVLAAQGLVDRVQASQRCLADRQELLQGQQVLLVACIDLPPLLRRLLQQVSGVAYCPGPTQYYESDGSLRSGANLEFEAIPDSNLLFGSTPEDTLAALFAALAEHSPSIDAGALTLGIASTELAPLAQLAAQSLGMELHQPESNSVGQSALGRLPTELACFFRKASGEAFAALLRNPVLAPWLEQQAQLAPDELLQAYDYYLAEMLPYRVSSQDFAARPAQVGLRTALSAAQRVALGSVLSALEAREQQYCRQAAQPLALLAPQLRQLLIDLLQCQTVSRDSKFWNQQRAAVEALQQQLNSFEQSVADCSPRFEFAAALELLAVQLAAVPATESSPPEAIEMLGWLELLLDDAPLLLVLGLNEGLVPEAVIGDPFLPDSLRAQLGLVDNQRRLERDRHVLWAGTRVRQQFFLGASRVNQRAEPVLLSRVVLADSAAATAGRLRRFYGADALPTLAIGAQGTLAGGRADSEHSRLQGQHPDWPPRPAPLGQALDSLAITALRDYLACPYRFYLKHVLRIEGYQAENLELEAAAYGVLVHRVLQRMAQRYPRGHVTQAELAAFLEKQLAELFESEFAHVPQPALRFQWDSILGRLHATGKWHREWLSEGWQVHQLESSISGEAGKFLVDDTPIYLRGRVDRIDYHPQRKQYAVLDYKTAQRAQTPEQTHCARDGSWRDLQLPLYEHLLRSQLSIDPASVLELGFVQVCDAPEKIGIKLARWNCEQLAAARDCAAQVVRAIRLEKFWPPSRASLAHDPFERLLTQGVA